MSEGGESNITKKLSQEFSKTESRIHGTLSKLEGLFLIHKSEHNPEPFREDPGTLTQKTKN